MPTLASAESVKVFVLAGHSLMLGIDRAENLDPSWNVPQDDVLIWLDHNMDGIGDWVTLEPGHGGPTHSPHPDDPEGITPGGDGHIKVGPELSLGRTLADAYPNERIALIKHGRGGGTIGTDWNPENVGPPESADHPWSGLLKKTSDALEALEAAGHSYEVEGFFWSLGGRDARNWNDGASDPDEFEAGRQEALARSAMYGEGLTNFIGAVRDEFKDELPFVMEVFPTDYHPQVHEAYPGVDLVREAQIDVSETQPWTVGVSATGITRLADHVHYDAMGSVELGTRYGNAYIDLVSVPEPSGAILGVISVLLLVVRTRRKPN